MRRKFNKKQLGETKNYSSYRNFFKNIFSVSNITRSVVTLICIGLVIYFGNTIIYAAKGVTGFITKQTVNTISKQFGDEMKKDEYGNINILIVGCGGAKHTAGFLADSIMVASRNPKLGTVTLISVPRDLRVYDKNLRDSGRINSVFATAFWKKKDFGGEKDKSKIEEMRYANAADIFGQKLEDITGLKVPYYAVVDFEEFKSFIDDIGGLTINVEKRIYDTAYPSREGGGYTTFSLSPGIQILNGDNALKYARSRHSTSDFDRSKRQQVVVKAILDKILSKENLSISKFQKLYDSYIKIVHTNITRGEIVGIVQYAEDMKNVFSFGLTTVCSYEDFEGAVPGCFLYTPNRDAFGGASVMLPIGGSSTNPSAYDNIRNFSFFVAHNQKYLIENPRIALYNGIDKAFAKKLKKKHLGHAGDIAVKLKKYAFNVVEVGNSEKPIEETSLYLASNTIDYSTTIDLVHNSFISIKNIYTGQSLGTGIDMMIVLGNDYLTNTIDKKFNFDK